MRTVADKSLKRLAPTSYSESGVPQVIVPDEVFHRGAALHQDFIVGAFFAKMPAYKAIENVLNFLWGKGTKLEIHTNTVERTMIVRIPNTYIRQKVLEKRLWYVGSAMFHVSPWKSDQSAAVDPDLLSIPIWAHLKGVPFDLRHQEGLSYAAGLVGEPKETDEYTKNLTNIGIAHVKVDADLTIPLPSVVELKRQSGEIIQVNVEYPWVPPSCAFCKQIGHIQKDCLHSTPTWVPADKTEKNKSAASQETVVTKSADGTSSSHPVTSSSHPVTEVQSTSASPMADPSTSEPHIVPLTSSDSQSVPSFSPPPVIPTTEPITFSASENTSLALALAPSHSHFKRPKPFKHKQSLKRPFSPLSTPILPDLNPFAILTSSNSPPKKFLKLTTEKDQNHPPIQSPLLALPAPPTPCEGPLLLQGVSPVP